MTIASDYWIRAQCLGALHYELYYDNDYKGVFDLNHFAHDKEELQAIKELKAGEEYVFKKLDTAVKVKCGETLPPNGKPLITPFLDHSCKTLEVQQPDGSVAAVKCPSYGLSSYGYDIRVDRKFKVFDKWTDRLSLQELNQRIHRTQAGTAAPGVIQTVALAGLNHDEYVVDVEADFIDIPANGFVLGVSIEHVCMPKNVTATCMAKSTLARLGLVAMVTPIEAGWSGYITLEIKNESPNTIRLYAGVGIMQLLFHVGAEACSVSYSDRAGKYMDQPPEPVMGAF